MNTTTNGVLTHLTVRLSTSLTDPSGAVITVSSIVGTWTTPASWWKRLLGLR